LTGVNKEMISPPLVQYRFINWCTNESNFEIEALSLRVQITSCSTRVP